MLISSWAVAMNLIAIALLGFFIAALIMSCAWLLLNKFINLFSMKSQKSLVWGWVAGPWFLGLITTLLFSPLFANTFLYRWIEEVAHWHHLYVFQMSSWHGISVILFVFFSVALISMKGWQLYQQNSAVQVLNAFSNSHQKNYGLHNVVVLQSDVPTAFTSGLFKPKCYVSSGLINNLSDKELDIVIQHELAHAHKKDPLSKLFIAFLSAYYPKKIAMDLNAKYSLITEHLADRATAIQHSAEYVASTLVKVARLQKVMPTQVQNPALSYFGANSITQRVQQLLNPTNKSIPLLIPLSSMLIMLCLTVLAVDATHHLVETIFTHS
ncbi:peptidase M56 BlaR1 [Paraglaciecola sp. MB-3u-78]|nr:peptidase M56 BlaR1 [Paraglaciecola sp. MB-3u-78]